MAWLARLLGYVTRFKRIRRTHRFKPDWRDSWADLRHSEWLRNQLIAQGAAQLLGRQATQLDDKRIQLTPPPTYGGPCPRTPFDMSRLFIPLARSVADPETIIRERFKRISRAVLVAHASTDALRRACHEAMGFAGHMERPSTWRAEARRGRQHEGGLTSAGDPPAFQMLRVAD